MHMTRAQLAIALLAALGSPVFAGSAVVPDPTLTPGAAPTTEAAAICSSGTRQLRHWDRARHDRIMAEYGLPAGAHPDYEVDHLRIGGADDVRNLWPEQRRTIEPEWNAEAKDRLEWRLRDLVCSGQLDVHEAQRLMAEDWVEAYGRFVPPPGNVFPPAAWSMPPK
jgi:hypothetical protein